MCILDILDNLFISILHMQKKKKKKKERKKCYLPTQLLNLPVGSGKPNIFKLGLSGKLREEE